MIRLLLLSAVAALTLLNTSCFFGPCSGCGHNHGSVTSEPLPVALEY